MRYRGKIVDAIFIIIMLQLSATCQRSKGEFQDFTAIEQLPSIDPDYTDTVIPPNIAPLNFQVKEPGKQYSTTISSKNGEDITICSKKSIVDIPIKAWKKLLDSNRGEQLKIDIYVKDQADKWNKFKTLTDQIADEDIDGYAVYRIFEPLYIRSNEMGLYQRNIQTFKETAILKSHRNRSCINCHSFFNNNPDKMFIHMRGGKVSGTLLARGGELSVINTSTKFNKASGAYRSWHPNGELIAFSSNIPRQGFHSTGLTREARDLTSDIILYNMDSNVISTFPSVARPDRMESYPAWSHDGKYLYFCSAPAIDSSTTYEQYKDIKYDLMRITYEPKTGEWGQPETVLASSETGKSIGHPKFSPDGRFLLFTMADYGTLLIFHPEADLYIMDMDTREYHRLDCNSDDVDSYHSWSSNSRWFIFASKRRDPLCARLYISYVDEDGKAYKAFLLPQKDPTFYESFLKTYNVPELIAKPIGYSERQFTNASLNPGLLVQAQLDPKVKLDHVTGATAKADAPYSH